VILIRIRVDVRVGLEEMLMMMMLLLGVLVLLSCQLIFVDRDIHFSSSSSRYFAFFLTPSVHCCPIPFFTHRVHGRSIMSPSCTYG
jgi:hypothetical protein